MVKQCRSTCLIAINQDDGATDQALIGKYTDIITVIDSKRVSSGWSVTFFGMRSGKECEGMYDVVLLQCRSTYLLQPIRTSVPPGHQQSGFEYYKKTVDDIKIWFTCTRLVSAHMWGTSQDTNVTG